MRRKQMRKLPDTPRRGAFTLVELLVVIAIMVALVAMAASAVVKFISSQQEANTQATLDKTQSVLNRMWSRVKDEAWKEPIPAGVDLWIRQHLAGIDSNATGRVRVIYVKLRLRQAFPMNFAEALNVPYVNPLLVYQPMNTMGMPVPTPSPVQPLSGYVAYLTKLGVPTMMASGTYVPDPRESSACLLMALQRGQSGQGIDPAELVGGGSVGSWALPGGSIPYLTDNWGMPIYFSRVPVGAPQFNSSPYPGLGLVGNYDPLDPQGYLQTGNWVSAPSGISTLTFGQLFTALTLQQVAGQNCSYMQAPMLCSSGLDKQMWVNPITFGTGGPYLAAVPPYQPGGDELFSKP